MELNTFCEAVDGRNLRAVVEGHGMADRTRNEDGEDFLYFAYRQTIN